MGNDLQGPAVALCPAIGEALAALRATPGCLLARMSGSGATCFGLYADAAAAASAAELVRRPGWWVWGGAC
jgi:4-diphosphocytidyl-2-C-methyl-D-erythritol kinase